MVSSLFHGLQKISHLYRGKSRVPALVAALRAGPLYGLLYRIGGYYAEGYGHAGFNGCLGYTLRRLSGHEIKVRRRAADYGPYAYYGVVGFFPGEGRDDERHLESAGHLEDVYVFSVHAAS